jgi:hypothetical protein
LTATDTEHRVILRLLGGRRQVLVRFSEWASQVSSGWPYFFFAVADAVGKSSLHLSDN